MWFSVRSARKGRCLSSLKIGNTLTGRGTITLTFQQYDEEKKRIVFFHGWSPSPTISAAGPIRSGDCYLVVTFIDHGYLYLNNPHNNWWMPVAFLTYIYFCCLVGEKEKNKIKICRMVFFGCCSPSYLKDDPTILLLLSLWRNVSQFGACGSSFFTLVLLFIGLSQIAIGYFRSRFILVCETRKRFPQQLTTCFLHKTCFTLPHIWQKKEKTTTCLVLRIRTCSWVI